jgi:hypothetical protein
MKPIPVEDGGATVCSYFAGGLCFTQTEAHPLKGTFLENGGRCSRAMAEVQTGIRKSAFLALVRSGASEARAAGE